MTVTVKPSIAWEDVEQALVDWASDITGLETIWAEDGGPQPDRPYVVLDWLVPPSTVGDDYLEDEVDEDTQEISRSLQGVRRSVLTVRVESSSVRAGASGRNAMYFADLLANSLSMDEVTTSRFHPVRMAPWDWQDVRKEDFTEHGKAVSRAAFDLVLGFSAGTGEESARTERIMTVSITGTTSTPEEEYESATAIAAPTS